MAITIIQHPPSIIAGKMPVVFTLHTSLTAYCHITGGIATNEDSIEPDTSRNVTFEFSDYVRDLPALHFNSNTPFSHPDAFPSVFFFFQERTGTPPVNQNYTESGLYHIINAGIPYWKMIEGRTIGDILANDAPFLTWYPIDRKRKVLPSEIIHLYFLPLTEGNLWRGMFEVLYTDGSIDTFYIETLETSGQVLQFNASPSFAEIYAENINPGKIIAEYLFYVFCPDTNDNSDYRSFVINRLPYEHTTQLFFRNSWGTFDQFLCKGKSNLIANSDRLTADQVSDYSQSPKPDRINWFNKGRNTLNVETGYLLRDESTWLSELMLSTEIYIKQGTYYVPVELKSDKVTVRSDENALLNISLEFGILQTPIIEKQ